LGRIGVERQTAAGDDEGERDHEAKTMGRQHVSLVCADGGMIRNRTWST
jgi:hypothetical protein